MALPMTAVAHLSLDQLLLISTMSWFVCYLNDITTDANVGTTPTMSYNEDPYFNGRAPSFPKFAPKPDLPVTSDSFTVFFILAVSNYGQWVSY
jgi:hypothetical protein